MGRLNLKVIGHGGAFDYNMPNSSFLVETAYGKWLVDCGYNIFSTLKKMETNKEIDISTIRNIFITHMDDDHIGSLKTLLYYRYFILNEFTNIYCSPEIQAELNYYLKDINKESANGEFISAKICNVIPITTLKNTMFDFIVKTTTAIHHTPTSGVMFIDNKYKTAIWISGDTIASKDIMSEVVNTLKEYSIKEVILLHDFSYWDEPKLNVHACNTNINCEYNKEFKNMLIYYHNKEKVHVSYTNIPMEV